MIALILLFGEVSMLPHFLVLPAGPFLLLPFISIISMKDRTIFPIILAAIMGIFTDGITGNRVPLFTITYVLVVLVSKLFFTRFTSYGEMRASLISLTGALVIILGVDMAVRFMDISSWSVSWILPLSISIALTYFLLFIYLWVGHRYFTWVEKETEERFR